MIFFSHYSHQNATIGGFLSCPRGGECRGFFRIQPTLTPRSDGVG